MTSALGWRFASASAHGNGLAPNDTVITSFISPY